MHLGQGLSTRFPKFTELFKIEISKMGPGHPVCMQCLQNCNLFIGRNVPAKVELKMEPVHLVLAYVATVRIHQIIEDEVESHIKILSFIFSVLLTCNSTASENNTYLYQSSSSSITSPCNYKICPCSTNICRIRYDFTVRTLDFSCF